MAPDGAKDVGMPLRATWHLLAGLGPLIWDTALSLHPATNAAIVTAREN